MSMLLFILAISFSFADRIGDTSSGITAPAGVKSSYCEEFNELPHASGHSCGVAGLAKIAWEAATATQFVDKCPQSCSSLKVIERNQWGGANSGKM